MPDPHPPKANLATMAAALVVGQQVASKTVRDALFLERFPVSDLPKLMAAGAALSILAVYATSRTMPRLGPSRMVRGLLIANAGLFAAEAALLGSRWTAVGIYLHVAALGAVLVSGFWGIISESFDPHEARKVMGRLGAGATLGGALAGIVADLTARAVGTRGLLVVLGAWSAGVVLILTRLSEGEGVARSTRPARESGPPDASLFGTLRGTPHLITLAAFAALGSVWAGFFDYSMKSEVVGAVGETSLVTFFGWFYTATSVLTFVVQATLGDRVLRRLGLTWAVAMLPILVIVGGLVGGLIGGFVAIAAVRAGESVLANSLYRAGYELYFTPLSSAAKRRAKTFVDVSAGRFGDAIGGGIILVAIAVSPTMTSATPLIGASIAAAIALALVPRLHSGYVEALTSALKRGAVALPSEETLDATTRRTLAESSGGLDRARLLAEIEAYRQAQNPEKDVRRSTLGGGVVAISHASGADPDVGVTIDARVALTSVLTSRDDARIRSALARPVDPPMARLVVSLLARPKVADDVERALRALGGRITGALSDALIDPDEPAAVRLRIPRLLESIGDARAVAGLSSGLETAKPEVRCSSARALARMFIDHPELRPDGAALHALAQRGLSAGGNAGPARAAALAGDSLPFDVPDAMMLQLDVGATIALTILAPILDRDALGLAVRALAQGDGPLRGTALEWIENVVEAPLKDALVARLGVRPKAAETKKRTERELRDVLLMSRG